MTLHRQIHFGSQRRILVAWQDCAWFPPVLAAKRPAPVRPRRRVYWPVQIITDPTVCVSRALDPIEL